VSFWEHLSHDVAQAVGMVSAQAKCTATQAMDLMRDRAHAQRQTVDEIAEGVLDRSIRFDR
jgi:AmiR/NasT family two-component response regulator